MTEHDAESAIDDEPFMRRALELAREAAREGEVPVGCVVVVDGKVAGEGRNMRERLHDPAAHAEIVALRAAGAALGTWRLDGATLYATCEPCPMCAGAAVQARVARVVFGCADPKGGGVVSRYRIGIDGALNHAFALRGGVLAAECAALLREFFAGKR